MKKILIMLLLLQGFSSLYSQVPSLITLQGVLLDDKLSPMQGTKLIKASIYDKLSGGSPLYSQQDQVTLLPGGIYNILLGKDTNGFNRIPFNKPLFIQVDVNNEVATERIPLTTTPYAFMAHKVQDSSISEIHLDSNLIKKINDSYTPMNGQYPGEMKYWNGRSWESIAPGKQNDFLTLCQGNIPQWGPCPKEPVLNLLFNSNRYDDKSGSHYLSRDKIKLIVTAYDMIGREPLHEVGVIYGSKPNLTINDSTTSTTSIGISEQRFEFIISDLINRGNTYVRAYAKNRAGIVLSDELMIRSLSHPISDTVITYRPQWMVYDTSRKSFIYLISHVDSTQKIELKEVYTYSTNNKVTIKSLNYTTKISDLSYNLTGSFCTKGNELHIYDYDYGGGIDSIYRITKVEIDNSGSFNSIRVQSKFSRNSTNLPSANGDYSGNDLFYLSSRDNLGPYLYKLENGEFQKELFSVSVNGSDRPSICIVQDGVIIANVMGIRKFPKEGFQPFFEQIKTPFKNDWKFVEGNYGHDPQGHVIKSTKLTSFYFVDWFNKVLYKISQDLKIEKEYALPDIPGISLLSKNNAVILEEGANLRLFIPSVNDSGYRILSYDLVD